MELADDRQFPDQWITLDLTIPRDQGGRIGVHVEADYDYHKRVCSALLAMLANDLSEQERALLQREPEQTGTTAFRLCLRAFPDGSGHDKSCDERP